MQRQLGRTGIQISAMGLGCWAIGGVLWEGNDAVGWGEVDDRDSIAALRRGIEMGITFIDTADNYGAGHSERVVGEAVRGLREKVVISTKFGNTFDEATKQMKGGNATSEYALKACEASLKRLGTDYIDLYLFHLNDCEPSKAPQIMEVLESLVQKGKIRCYGWSTDHPDRAQVFAQGEHCAAIEHDENIFVDNGPMLELCRRHGLASVNRAPLAMGLLTGKYSTARPIDDKDVRGSRSPAWMRYFQKGAPSAPFLKKLESIREIITSNGRSVAQGSLAWIWARSHSTIPIPGFRNEKQVIENVRAMELGPLEQEQMTEIEGILASLRTS